MRIFDFDGTLIEENSPDLVIEKISHIRWRYRLIYLLLYGTFSVKILKIIDFKRKRKVLFFRYGYILKCDYEYACREVSKLLTPIPAVFDKIQDNSIIISASFEVLIKQLLPNNTVYANQIFYSGPYCRFVLPDCIGVQKVNRLIRDFSIEELSECEFYSDSKDDLPLFDLCAVSYVVRNNSIIKYEKGIFT